MKVLATSLSEYRYVEVANYVPDLQRVIRWRKRETKEPILIDQEGVERFRDKHNNTGIYTSVFRYLQPELGNSVGPVFFDIDNEDLEESLRDAKKLFNYLSENVGSQYIRWFFTGSKGFHMEISANYFSPSPHLPLAKVYREIAQDAKDSLDIGSLDFAVYDERRMWRLVNSRHQKTGLYKVELPKEALSSSVKRIEQYAEAPRPLLAREEEFNMRINRWYKNWVSSYEERLAREKREAAAKRAQIFGQFGTSVLEPMSTKGFNTVLNNCMEELSKTGKGGRNDELNKQGYILFLAAMRSNTSEEIAEEHLKKAGEGMGLDHGEIVATLNSAKKAAEKTYRSE